MQPPLQAGFHTASDARQRLFLRHDPPAGVARRGAVLYVHPWAEEMNKSRRMAALAARALAADGWTVLQPDLLGCGDSAGDFGDADWARWIEDVVEAALCLRSHAPAGPLWLWGLRAGALLCCAAAARLPACPQLLLWQPAAQGKAVLQQFLRLKAAAQLADGGGKAILDAARAELAAGRPVEVAGYRLSAALAAGLQAATLTPPDARGASPRLVWLETRAQPDPAPSPAAQAALAHWQAAGWQAQYGCVGGPAFWQTTEIEDAPALVQATLQALAGAPAAENTAESAVDPHAAPTQPGAAASA